MNSTVVKLPLAFYAILICVSPVLALPGSPLPRFDVIGTFNEFRASGISPNGKYVTGWWFGLTVGQRQAFRWDADTGVTFLGDLPGGRIWSLGNAVSDQGIVVGTAEVTATGTAAFRWDQNSGMTNLGSLGGSTIQGFANDISADGSVIVGLSRNAMNRQVPFRWTQQTGMVSLGLFGGQTSSEATGVSADGTVIVGGSSGQGWYWKESVGLQGVGLLAGGNSIPRAASEDGSVIVGDASSSGVPVRVAFYWNGPGTITSLGNLPESPNATLAFGVSADGKRIVGASNTDIAVIIEQRASGFQVFDLKQYAEQRFGLDLTGWQLQEARDISSDGRAIVGWGIAPDGKRLAWRMSLPIPEPSTFVLLSCMALFVLTSRSLLRRAT